MAGTAVLSGPQFVDSPVWERIITFTFASGDESTEVKQAVPINGILQKIIVACGTATGETTAAVAIDDNAGIEIWAVSSLAKTVKYPYSVSEPLTGVIDVGVTPTTDPSSSYVVTVYLRGI